MSVGVSGTVVRLGFLRNGSEFEVSLERMLSDLPKGGVQTPYLHEIPGTELWHDTTKMCCGWDYKTPSTRCTVLSYGRALQNIRNEAIVVVQNIWY